MPNCSDLPYGYVKTGSSDYRAIVDKNKKVAIVLLRRMSRDIWVDKARQAMEVLRGHFLMTDASLWNSNRWHVDSPGFWCGDVAMNAVQIAEFEALSAPRTSVRPAHLEGSSICITPRIEAALTALLQALEYAQDLDRSAWDFAVEISSLRSLKLSKSDLRWLVGKGLVETAIEVTMAGDVDRSFRQPPAPLFCKKACFTLTSVGATLARELCGRVDVGATNTGRTTVQPPMPKVSPVPEPLLPSWDRDRQKLTVGSIVVKHFKVPAANQEAILAAFEEESWPPRIDDPLPPHREQPPKRRLQETIKSLNRNQKRSLIRFVGDGSGQGVCWEFCGEMDHPFQAVTELP